MCNKKTFHIIIAVVIIVIALALAIAVSIWHQQGLAYIIFVSRFFDVMIPILGVGALIKYLTHSCHCGCCCCHHHEHEHEQSEEPKK